MLTFNQIYAVAAGYGIALRMTGAGYIDKTTADAAVLDDKIAQPLDINLGAEGHAAHGDGVSGGGRSAAGGDAVRLAAAV